MFPTFGRGVRKGKVVPRQGRNFLKWKIYPIADKLGIPKKLVTFQVMRRTLGTDMQGHGTMKDAQQILRHASIKTTAEIYMQEIQASVCSKRFQVGLWGIGKWLKRMAPQVGFEPTTLPLTAELCATR